MINKSMADCILPVMERKSSELTECNDNLRMQPCNTFIIGRFPSGLRVSSGKVLALSVHIT